MAGIKREELDELDVIIRDLRMAIDIKEQIDSGVERGLITFADGENISVPITDEAKQKLEEKINSLSNLIRERGGKFGVR